MRNVSALPADLFAGLKQGVVIGLAALACVLPPATGPFGARLGPVFSAVAAPKADASQSRLELRTADFTGHSASRDAQFVADWVADSRDNQSLPFVILDKRAARIFVFDADARLIDASPVLLGAAPGDDSVAGIGMRAIADVKPEERTTPAGRFLSMPGRNAAGEDVVWVDYTAAVSMHRVRVVDPTERRLERLASPDASQRRISYGCINIPVAFYDAVIRPVLGAAMGVVYVLPENKGVREVFGRAYPVLANMVQFAPRNPKGTAL